MLYYNFTQYMRTTFMSSINANKIAYISCVNDTEQFAECLYYLDRLMLPDGFEKDVIAVQNAPSMAAGYNAGMKSSDARYKVYLHQDLHIINHNFISDLVNVFQSNPDIGILGCVGTTNLGREAMAVTSWNVGKVIQNLSPMLLAYGNVETAYAPVMALDGLLLATQYDIDWREDLMDGWDFYDISQCMEFTQAGYEVVVPYQDQPWCYHDNHSSNMKNYNLYRRRFIDEYRRGQFQMPPESEQLKEYHDLKHESHTLMEQLICSDDHAQMHKIFQEPSNRGFMHLKDYEIIADTDYLEQRSNAPHRLWQAGMSAAQILQRMQQLKFWVHRIEFKSADTTRMMDQILSEYSIYAVLEIFVQYTLYKEYTYKEIMRYLTEKSLMQELAVWELIRDQL